MGFGTAGPLLLLQLLTLTSTRFGAAMVQRVGCMVLANTEKDLAMERFRGRASNKASELAQQRGPFRTMVGDSSGMTVQSCVQRCWMKRFSFAALQDGSRCFCANRKDGLVSADSSLCFQRCGGNLKQLCGGTVALSVYRTGYHQEPIINDVDMSKGLLGCFAERSWKTMCGPPPPSPEVVEARKQKFQQHGTDIHEKHEVHEPPDEDIMATYKPPLISVRMSALLCAAYCVSGRSNNSLAVLKSNDTCCCGRSRGNLKQRDEVRVSFAEFCNVPCAEKATRPYCVGKVNNRRYISAYDTLAIWPQASTRPPGLYANGSWWKPVFPADTKFEVSAFQPKWTPSDQDELSGLTLLLPEKPLLPPIVDQYNFEPFVSIVDVPEDDNRGGGWRWMLMIVLAICLFLAITIAIILLKRRKTPQDEELLEDDYPSVSESIKIPEEAGEESEMEELLSESPTSRSRSTGFSSK